MASCFVLYNILVSICFSYDLCYSYDDDKFYVKE